MTKIQYISQLGTPAQGSASAADIVPVTQGSTGALTGTSRKMTLAEMAGGVGVGLNVKAFGATGGGVVVDSAAIQAAADAVPDTGGILRFPPGVYVCDTPVLLKSNTIIMAYGATFKATLPWHRLPQSEYPLFWESSYWFFANKNLNSLTIVDENIEVWGGTFDYTDLTYSPNGGRHAICLRRVRNVKVVGGTLIDGDDFTAFLGCDDTLVLGCSAYDFINCAYDHWAGTKNARVIGCFARSNRTVQMVNFNSVGDTVPGQVFENGIIQGCTFEHPTGGVKAYSSIFLDPLGSGHTTKNIVIQGNILKNVIIVGRGNVQNTLIQGNQFIGTPGAAGPSPIAFYTDGTDTPDGITVDNNTFIAPQTAAPAVAVIDLRTTNPRCTNNRITGGGYSVPGYSMPSASKGIEFGNLVSSGNYGGNGTISSGNRIKAANDEGVSFKDAVDAYVRLYVDSSNNFLLRTTDAGGGLLTIFAVPTRDSAPVATFTREVRFQNNLLQSVALNLTATGTVRTNALSLTSYCNDVTTTPPGTGVRLNFRTLGVYSMVVRNGGANALNVYPLNGTDQIDALGAGNPYVLAAGSVGRWTMFSNGQWYTESVSP